ncbi:transcriptional activator protein Pur-beta-like isoform X3 [Vespa mandarinia]|uniref:transcriptional activator protein Pur-beta-like isoform X3 n=1 Tax=Vespa mandarinia TaxID=7446 RepID=UPI00161EE68E|nr:transcriptional activator protein Pur-beta-like isoform X3 [Vespa mandarinia]XP_035736913.1 transcriptional activator protein Pur-beta-like isoform X3 [Vespa mandarinia]XP_035737010.1 transcriptional activator protein Pur-beta-like isoform X3 [Vespa mandarinia]
MRMGEIVEISQGEVGRNPLKNSWGDIMDKIQYWCPEGQQGQQNEQELATKMLQIQSKRFYLDVKQNRRGRFIKVAEIGADGRRSQIYLALSTAFEFRNHLSTFSDYYASLGPPNPENVPDDGKLKSEMMVKDNRRYYLDLKENSRGRFLRVSHPVSQTITRGGPRTQIAIPAQGMIEFRDALTDLLEEFGSDDGGFKGDLPDGRYMRVEGKNFYFDIGQNNRGIYMRISEVKTNFRTAITVPEKSWARFRDIFADYCEKMQEGGGAGVGVGGMSGGSGGSGGNVLSDGKGSVVAQVSQSKRPNSNNNNSSNNNNNNNNNKSKIEKRQSEQHQRESLKRRKSLPQHGETSTVNPTKSMSASVSQLTTTTTSTTTTTIPATTVPSIIIDPSPSNVNTSIIAATIVGQKSNNVNEGNISTNSATKTTCDMQILQFEPIEI